jgi:hypothetical protein
LTLKIEAKILENKRAKTQYITIPAQVARDSQYPFKKNDVVELEIDPQEKKLVVRLLGRPVTGKK